MKLRFTIEKKVMIKAILVSVLTAIFLTSASVTDAPQLAKIAKIGEVRNRPEQPIKFEYIINLKSRQADRLDGSAKRAGAGGSGNQIAPLGRNSPQYLRPISSSRNDIGIDYDTARTASS